MKLPRIQHPLFALTLTAVSLAAFAQTPRQNSAELAPEWTKTDTDRDGFLTKEELIPFPSVLKQFEVIDVDRDGKISQAEYADWVDAGKPTKDG
ncbi:EF-hand domain-containing protein [Dokdonella koreensis]|uniref:Ca2+ sensor n=1 Tax=Dokdonella koreensis DS-123 TaxID=1300342 RepID=A0A160DXS6_9GAMM|nr:EF-hand domain-containing protein [Dokdonella koreensis]ANB19549.1 Ca2+ sensor [Dokdonella koreensis DS-123]